MRVVRRKKSDLLFSFYIDILIADDVKQDKWFHTNYSRIDFSFLCCKAE